MDLTTICARLREIGASTVGGAPSMNASAEE